jgi:uncharacterized protein DUF2785
MILSTLVAATLAAAPAHSAAFWYQIAQNNYAVPTGGDVASLTDELIELLGSRDPELRDEIAYSTLAAWIYQTRVIEPALLRRVVDRLLANLKDDVGERGTDRIFRRSFSALTLSVVVARDNAAPFLTPEEFHRIEEAALAYLAAEQDLRGYDPQVGWMHSAAHTADLVKFIARSRFLDRTEQPRILDAIARKLTTGQLVFTHGEDERFARAALSIVARADFDRAAFDAWTSRSKPPRQTSRPTTAELNSAQNVKNFLSKLEVVLASDPQASEAVQSARDSVRAALKDLF